jgi:hypothetical protein
VSALAVMPSSSQASRTLAHEVLNPTTQCEFKQYAMNFVSLLLQVLNKLNSSPTGGDCGPSFSEVASNVAYLS